MSFFPYEVSPHASSAEVRAQIYRLGQDKSIHGILTQRPLPDHLDGLLIMSSIHPLKNIEEFCNGQTANIAADAFSRLISKYGKLDLARQSTIHIAGSGNIVTDSFIIHMKKNFRHVLVTPSLPCKNETNACNNQIKQISNKNEHRLLITELHRGPEYITIEKLPTDAIAIVDLGFYITENGIIAGDVDQKVYEETGLFISPTPGGLLPVLLWVMMERTIRAKLKLMEK